MGQKISSEIQNENGFSSDPKVIENHLRTEYTQIPISSYNQDRYQNATIYQHNIDASTISVLQQRYQDKLKFQEGEEQCKQLLEMQHDAIVKVYQTISVSNEQFCSTTWNLNLYQEYCDEFLALNFQKRLDHQINYHESELWHILVSVVAALAYLEDKQVQHNDIRPYSILVNQEGKVKIQPSSVMTRQLNAFQELLTEAPDNHGIYLSPAQVEGLRDNVLVQSSKDNVFALGLTVLECALMKRLEVLDLENYVINQQILQESLQEVQQLYGQNLFEFLSQMLILNQEERPDAEELFRRITSLTENGLQAADRLFLLTQFLHPEQEQQQTEQSPVKVEQVTEQVIRSAAPQEPLRAVPTNVSDYCFPPEVEAILVEYRQKIREQQQQTTTTTTVVQNVASTIQQSQQQPQSNIVQSTYQAYQPQAQQAVSATYNPQNVTTSYRAPVTQTYAQ